MTKFDSTFKYKLIYIFRINDKPHKNLLKIGDATVTSDNNKELLLDNCEALNEAAKNRINQYTRTAAIQYELLYTTLAITNKNKSFRDHNVHNVLKRSGIKNLYLNNNNRNEWYYTDLETAKKAIEAVKVGRKSLDSKEITTHRNPIILRPEQREAVSKTIDNFKKNNRMLWNAKMRFGKTISALSLIKEKNYNKTLILSHRPVVGSGWFDDFNKIFDNKDNYLYGSKNFGENLDNLINSNKNIIYFASIQDVRESSDVGGRFEKNEEIFNIDWDLLIIDEAHEGTKTDLGKKTIEAILNNESISKTKLLELSGTPFNLMDTYEEAQIYTWDYVMEQSSKLKWEEENYGDSNPYSDLPQMNIFTYDLDKQISGFLDLADKSFNFREFFRTWTGNVEVDRKEVPSNVKVGDFIHEESVIKFLDLISLSGQNTNYPYSTEEYRDFFRHTLWMLPGVKEAKALSSLLKSHQVFGSGMFKIVNVAGDGDEEDTSKSKELVDRAISNSPEDTYTITLSCGRLTTGVSIPSWTAVLMLSGSNSTSAISYLQTIFRVQTPGEINGKRKDKCFVFDFAPDRALKMLAEAGQLSTKPGNITPRAKMGDLLNFCPVISVQGSRMIPYNVSTMLQTLKKAYADKVVLNGFDDTKIYNEKLLKLDGIELEEFQSLQAIIGKSKQSVTAKEITINDQGFTDEEYEKLEEVRKKRQNELTEEEKELKRMYAEQKKNAQTAISILRGISIRIPLLIYGADISASEDITLDNFTSLVDEASWNEFMPKGVTKEVFIKFSKYYDPDIFIAAGSKIRNIVRYADSLSTKERIKEISKLFLTFKNPDKETVLTPWKTVNRHMGDILGGFNFYEDQYLITIEEPRYIPNGEATVNVLNNEKSKVLEINSKSGLYPLYISYSLYRQKCLNYDDKKLTEEIERKLWEEVLEENIFVLCQTEMAKQITNRTLVGFSDNKTNVISDNDLIDKIKSDLPNLITDIKNPESWGKKGKEEMKFKAIVGNPPYQQLVADNSGTVSQANPVYNLFFELATELSDSYVSLIMPSLWMTGGTGLSKFREHVLKQNKITLLHDYEISDLIFDNVAIAGGVSYFLWDRNKKGLTKNYYYDKNNNKTFNEVDMSLSTDIFIREPISLNIINKVGGFKENFNSFMDVVSTYSPFANGKVGNYRNIIKNKKTSDAQIIIYKNPKTDGGKVGYIDRDKIIANNHWIDQHKIFVSKAGEISAKFNGLPFYGKPGTASTETYLVVGPFDSKETCKNVMNYMQTNLYKFMISQIKKTQNAARGVYKFVPMFDFTDNKLIDWTADLDKLNNKLYKLYNLSSDEIKYIEEKTT